MPWKLIEDNGGWYVEDDKGKRYSKMPMSRKRALAQMRALYANEPASKEISDQVLASFKRRMDPNTGGGVDRDKLAASDFVDPERRRFPIVKPGDVMDAVHSYGRAKPPIPFDEFKAKVIAICKRKGAAFVAQLPKAWGVETKEAEIAEKGGEGSGNFGHEGRPGEVGGSAPSGGGGGGSSGGGSLTKHGKISFENRGVEAKFNNKKTAIDQNIGKLDKKLSSSKKNSSEATEEDYMELTEINNRLRNSIERLGGRGTKVYTPAFGSHSLADFYHDEYNAAKSNVAELNKLISQIGRGGTVTSVELDDMNYVNREVGDAVAYFTAGKEAKEHQPSLIVYKDSTGADRWVLFSSNAYRDRDREIVSTKALEADVERADKEGNYGPLRWWHVGKPDPINQTPGPGIDIGTCDFNAMHGRVLIESGTFKHPKIAAAVKEAAPNLQVSIGYFHPRTEPDGAGVFNSIKRFERSLLPAGRASNPFTGMPVIQKSDGGTEMISEKIKAFAALLKDDELVQSILAQAEQKEKEAQDLGTTFKGEEPETPPTAPEQPAVEVEAKADTEDAEDAASNDPEENSEPMIGDMTPDAFAGMLAEAMGKAMEPYQAEIKALKASMTKKDDSEAALREALELQAQTVKQLKSQIDELTGSQPRAATKGYRDSQSADTVVKDDSKVKGLKPTVDPDFVKMFVP